jgi:tRNA (guanine26-N2/guanine27-N2)-dimethyltransferase
MEAITEGKAVIKVHTGKPTKKLRVFYNPLMKFNRDTSVLLLNALNRKNMMIADPLAGSGVRAIRFARELNRGTIKQLAINDYSKEAIKNIRKNIGSNVKGKMKNKIVITNQDATLFLLNSKGFDYIDVDPFGSPNHFLDAAVKRIARSGILAVTATDTAPLAGTYPRACKRKYWATPLRNEMKHEIGLRILIRKIQLVAAQYDKAAFPVFTYSKDHYYRVMFIIKKSKNACDEIIKQHNPFYYCSYCTAHGTEEKCTCSVVRIPVGPLWTGSLNDKTLVAKMENSAKESVTKKIIGIIKQEAQYNLLGFVDLHMLSKKIKQRPIKTRDAIKKINGKKYIATRTQFSATGIKTNAPIKVIQSLFVHQ